MRLMLLDQSQRRWSLGHPSKPSMRVIEFCRKVRNTSRGRVRWEQRDPLGQVSGEIGVPDEQDKVSDIQRRGKEWDGVIGEASFQRVPVWGECGTQCAFSTCWSKSSRSTGSWRFSMRSIL